MNKSNTILAQYRTYWNYNRVVGWPPGCACVAWISYTAHLEWTEGCSDNVFNRWVIIAFEPIDRILCFSFVAVSCNCCLKCVIYVFEKIWSRTHSTFDLKLLKSATNHYHTSIIKAKKLYNSTLLSSNLTNPKKLWNTINKLLHRIAKPSFPSSFHLDSLPQSFATFFSDKIHKLRTSILSGTTTSSPHLPPASKPPELSFFHPATIAEVSALLSSSPDTSCDLDPIPTSPQTMQICSSSHNHKYHQPIYVHWSLSWSIQKLSCTSTSQKIQPWQRKLIQLQASISPILPIQTHRTTC